jgi:hypothetical protein
MLLPYSGADVAMWRRPCLILACLASALTLSPSLHAQDRELDELRAELRAALATIATLEGRVSTLEGERTLRAAEDDLEAQLQALVMPEPAAPRRTVFPSAGNPRIGVFADAVGEFGNAEEKLGEDGDRFSLRETEVDLRLDISPFAEGVFITTFEDAGNGEFESHVEEGYATVAVGDMLDMDTTAQVKLGRFRVPFGTVNRTHTHDLPQVDRPYGFTQQLGEEGLIGDGVEATFPLYHGEGGDGLGSATTAQVALVNGEMLSGDEGLLGELADGAGLGLESDAPLVVARVSHFVELSALSDLELGASHLADVGSNSLRTDVGSKVYPSASGLDLTVRLRDDESGRGSWLFSAEAIRSDYDFAPSNAAGFPVGSDRSTGYWATVQRQLTANTYVGLRVGETDVFGTDGSDQILDVSPYVTWYADEFFRLRLQGQHLDVDSPGANESVNRVFLQSTWNFGAHNPHPYWSNR